MNRFTLRMLCAGLASALLLATAVPNAAYANDASTTSSALSLLPVAVVLAAPVALLSGGAALTVVAVEASATGTVWVLERASDGARASVRLSGELAADALLVVGISVLVVAVSTGAVLSAGSRALAFIPNELGAALLYNERVSR